MDLMEEFVLEVKELQICVKEASEKKGPLLNTYFHWPLTI